MIFLAGLSEGVHEIFDFGGEHLLSHRSHLSLGSATFEEHHVVRIYQEGPIHLPLIKNILNDIQHVDISMVGPLSERLEVSSNLPASDIWSSRNTKLRSSTSIVGRMLRKFFLPWTY